MSFALDLREDLRHVRRLRLWPVAAARATAAARHAIRAAEAISSASSTGFRMRARSDAGFAALCAPLTHAVSLLTNVAAAAAAAAAVSHTVGNADRLEAAAGDEQARVARQPRLEPRDARRGDRRVLGAGVAPAVDARERRAGRDAEHAESSRGRRLPVERRRRQIDGRRDRARRRETRAAARCPRGARPAHFDDTQVHAVIAQRRCAAARRRSRCRRADARRSRAVGRARRWRRHVRDPAHERGRLASIGASSRAAACAGAARMTRARVRRPRAASSTLQPSSGRTA